MAFLRSAVLIVMVSTSLVIAKGLPGTKNICEECKDALSMIKTHVLRELKSSNAEEITTAVCNFDDADLHGQCHELFTDHGDDFVAFVENLDVARLCEATLCQDLDIDDEPDYTLYFQSERRATRTDEVGGFACSICQRFMSMIHRFLTSKGHQGFVLHMLKGVCHFVPMFKTECELLINMYGRLIINLASRYLSPQLCKTFRLCPAQLPNMPCGEPLDIADGSKTFLDTAVGSTVEYSCNHGYFMATGDARRTCAEDGQWTGEAPVCLREVDSNLSD